MAVQSNHSTSWFGRVFRLRRRRSQKSVVPIVSAASGDIGVSEVVKKTSTPDRHAGHISSVKLEGENVLFVTIKVPSTFKFKAGQYIKLSGDDVGSCYLSVAAPPPEDVHTPAGTMGSGGKGGWFSCSGDASTAVQEDDVEVKLLCKRSSNALMTFLHKEATLGSFLWVQGGFGEFYFEPGMTNSLVLLSGGSGLAPFLSILGVVDRLRNVNATLLHSVRYYEDLLCVELLQAYMKKNPRIRVFFTLTGKQYSSETLVVTPDTTNTTNNVNGENQRSETAPAATTATDATASAPSTPHVTLPEQLPTVLSPKTAKALAIEDTVSPPSPASLRRRLALTLGCEQEVFYDRIDAAMLRRSGVHPEAPASVHGPGRRGPEHQVYDTNTIYMICGPKQMVADMETMLLSTGIEKTRIKSQ
eukprot:GFYU01003149.1.p1 GENE.GFYU01003149.1~~GFYU01003149.1.p1  ORF type:complete len:416 (-),score=64.18 GFYU01003149.1:328-1575(-)